MWPYSPYALEEKPEATDEILQGFDKTAPIQ